jgi:lysyl endopeptidase
MSRKHQLLYVSLIAIWVAFAPCTVSAEENGAMWVPGSLPAMKAAPQQLFEKSGIRPASVMARADETMVQSISDWNMAGNLPLRNGIERSLSQALLVVLEKMESGENFRKSSGGVLARSTGDDATVWGVALRAEKAWRMRIRLGDVRLPKDTRMWVYGENGETVGPFGTELKSPDGTLWTPSIGGPEIRLEISVPNSTWDLANPPSVKIEAISELFPLSEASLPLLGEQFQAKDTSCLQDAACVGTGDWPPINSVKQAVAHLQFQSGGISAICTGTLVNDKDQNTVVPYLLTANHCFSTQGDATTLEAFFDYIQSPCGGLPPDPGTLPRTNGSTLLSTSATSDFTFVRLSQLPSGSRSLLGWATTEPVDGAALVRVSHPEGLPAAFSISNKAATPLFNCGLSTTDFHSTDPLIGGTFGGSSGAAILNEDGQIVGQLFGQCGGIDTSDGCDYTNYQVDGKFAVTFPHISQYINVEGGGGGSCVQDLDEGVVCLRNGRFEFVGSWTDFANPANTRPLIWTPVENINATAGFQNNPSGIQIVMRVADGCSLTGTWWVWLGGFTDAGWNITVRDTVTGNQRNFSKPRQGGVFPITTRDSTTFSCN